MTASPLIPLGTMCAEAPLRCPACGDHLIEPMEGVCLSATIQGVTSEIHGVSAYHCADWHIFALIAPTTPRPPTNRKDIVVPEQSKTSNDRRLARNVDRKNFSALQPIATHMFGRVGGCG